MITLDHVGFAVADYARSKAFYEKALASLGITLLMEFSGAAARVRQGWCRIGAEAFVVGVNGRPPGAP